MYLSFIRVAIILVLQLTLSLFLQAQSTTPFEQDSNSTATYEEIIEFYEQLDQQYASIQLEEVGFTDVGKPLHAVIVSKDQDFEPASLRSKGKLVFFINNGIHAGEPCGIDASMMWVRDLIEQNSVLLDSIVLVVIPAYNIGGVLNRGSFSRANQDGPRDHGFRGNAKNLDLNRDFIKCDSKNAESFSRLFSHWDPDIFLDNHTTNGADYPYVMTLIATQKDKASPPIREYMQEQLLPQLYQQMNEETDYPMSIYVNVRNTPDQGIAGFLDLPRYSSGFATLHHSISFISEAHMLKPWPKRVWGTYALMNAMLEAMQAQKSSIQLARDLAKNSFLRQDSFPLNWSLDFSQKDSILFKGYEAKKKPSTVSGQLRMYYDHDATYEQYVPYYDQYNPTVMVRKPRYYIIPQGYEAVIRRLQWNGVRIQRIPQDSVIQAAFYYIRDYETRDRPYEAHYLHSNVQVESQIMERRFYRGDVLVEVDQPLARYIVETLEPQGADSFFAWNFFDGILQQKEYFSSYVFEETAEELLNQDPELKSAFEQAKRNDEKFRDNGRAQLDFIYRRSPYYEKTHMLYPVGRIIGM